MSKVHFQTKTQEKTSIKKSPTEGGEEKLHRHVELQQFDVN